MEISELIKLAVQNGGLAAVACLALFIVWQLVKQMVPDMVSKYAELTNGILASQDAHTEVMAENTEVLRQHAVIMKEVRDLLLKVNGKK